MKPFLLGVGGVLFGVLLLILYRDHVDVRTLVELEMKRQQAAQTQARGIGPETAKP